MDTETETETETERRRRRDGDGETETASARIRLPSGSLLLGFGFLRDRFGLDCIFVGPRLWLALARFDSLWLALARLWILFGIGWERLKIVSGHVLPFFFRGY